VLENLALRQQLTTYHIKKKQPRFSNIDRLFWVALKQVWERWLLPTGALGKMEWQKGLY